MGIQVLAEGGKGLENKAARRQGAKPTHSHTSVLSAHDCTSIPPEMGSDKARLDLWTFGTGGDSSVGFPRHGFPQAENHGDPHYRGCFFYLMLI
jgi:hypothetical protein